MCAFAAEDLRLTPIGSLGRRRPQAVPSTPDTSQVKVTTRAGAAAVTAFLAGIVAPAASPPAWAAGQFPLCVSVRQEVVAWSRQQPRTTGRARVVRIRGARLVANRVARSPANGILLSCRGRASLSNGQRESVLFGIRAIDNRWYLFMKRVRPR